MKKQVPIFRPEKRELHAKLEAAGIFLTMGESRYTGEGSLMTRWAKAVLVGKPPCIDLFCECIL